jgi:hypothetical protein
MIIKTRNIDRAAFFTTFGAEVEKIEGKYPDCMFFVRAKKWLFVYEALGGWLPYNRFCNERRKWKRETRRLSGLPEYFTGGKDTGFKLGDIAHVRPFSKKELSKIHRVDNDE